MPIETTIFLIFAFAVFGGLMAVLAGGQLYVVMGERRARAAARQPRAQVYETETRRAA